MSYQVSTETTKVHEITLTGRGLINFINGETLRDACRNVIYIPTDAEVLFSVPGGGDWGFCDITIDDECPVTIRWKTTNTGD